MTDSAVIDGYTQPESSPNTLAVGSDAVVLIELNGAGVGQANGLVLIGVTTSTVRGLAINRFQGGGSVFGGSGIYLPQGNGHVVAGNVIGLDPSGTTARPNAIAGVLVENGVSDVVVGGASPADRNVLSGNNGTGILFLVPSSGQTATNTIEGNYIGTDAGGTLDLGNAGHGVFVERARNNTIGGTAAGAGNLISGNDGDGVQLVNSSGAAGNNLVQGNRIGVNAAGTAKLGNARYGVLIDGQSTNTVGGTAPGPGT